MTAAVAPRDVLEAEVARLRDRVAVLEDVLGQTERERWQVAFALSPSEAAIFGLLMARPQARREAIMDLLYGLRTEPPDHKIVDVFVCKLRRKLGPRGIAIQTLNRQGFRLSSAAKARAWTLLDWAEADR